MSDNIKILEDNAGGLYLAVVSEEGHVLHLYSGFETHESGTMLREIIGAMKDGTDDWHGDSETPADDYERLTSHDSTEIIATGTDREITIFIDRMGAAALGFAQAK